MPKLKIKEDTFLADLANMLMLRRIYRKSKNFEKDNNNGSTQSRS